jgi:hypothetical protein
MLEVVSLNDSAVGSGQPKERKTKNLGNIGLDIETDLREIEEENPSRRIIEGLEATSFEQKLGTLARNMFEMLLELENLERKLMISKDFEFDRRTLFRTMNNQSIQEEAVIIDSKYDCQYSNNLKKIHIHKGVNRIMNNQIHEFSKRCRIKDEENFRIIIKEQYNLIVLTVFKMIDWW